MGLPNPMDVLTERGFIAWCSDEEGLRGLFSSGVVTGYVGFDPTAPSLHVGHLIPIMGLAWLQRLGHRPIAIAGGGTGMIGDPSGRSKERNLLSEEEIEANLAGIKAQLSRFLDFSPGPRGALLLNNYDWLKELSLIGFLRDVGKHFTVNYMISKEFIRSRLEDPDKSISYTEFSYMLLQAYDFYHLCREHDCRVQFGGNDQQGNITAGIELIRRKLSIQAYGCTYPLLLDSSGQKFGKTAEGAVWLDPKLTSPYRFYQFWMNVSDEDAGKLLRYYTFMEMEEIEGLMEEHAKSPHLRRAQRTLAFEVTRSVHGDEAAREVRRASALLFDSEGDPKDPGILALLDGEIPTFEVRTDLPAGLAEVLFESGAVPSKSEAKRLISSGGIYLAGSRVEEPDRKLLASDFSEGRLLLRKGKKDFMLLKLPKA